MDEIEDKLWECPGEAHELDNTFNPSSQGPYGPGYHDCDVCDNEYYVTFEVYTEELEWQQQVEDWRNERRTVEALMKSTKANVS